MRLFRHFSHAYKNLTPRLKTLFGLFLAIVILSAHSPRSVAFALDIETAGSAGGRIARMPDDLDCTPYCTSESSPQALVSLFALPAQGYRFNGWTGSCINTLGPLCTLMANQNIRANARFVKTKAPKTPTKALLLLHDAGLKHTVWNEFITQHFNNRCPVVYGGVVLGEDSFDPHNHVYCYRIAFGYYTMLSRSIATKGLQNTGSVRKNQGSISSKHLAYEVRAAVLGVLGRHPKLSLTLVGQERAALAAQSYLQENADEKNSVVGLLALQQAKHSKNGAELYYNQPLATGGASLLQLKAKPDQNVKINAALTQLTKSWWMTE